MVDCRLLKLAPDGSVEPVMLFNPDKEEIRVVKKSKDLSDEQKDIINCKKELKQYSNSLGGYINMQYVRNELLFNKVNIERANISRLIYLSTYIDYNDKNENLLVHRGQYNKNTPLNRKDIKSLLRLSDNAFRMFMKNTTENKLLYEVDGLFYIDTNYFNRGKIKNSCFKSQEYTRIFIDTTRFIYENCDPRQHKQLSYVFQLTPLIHYENNVICSNPSETNMKNIKRLNIKDICLFLGLSTSKACMSKIEKDLYKLFISFNESKYYVFKRVIIKGGDGNLDYFIVNPKVIWGGKEIECTTETMEKLIFIENLK